MLPVRLFRRLDLACCLFLCTFLAILFCPRMASADTVVITDANKGGAVHLKAGDTLEMRLKSNPSTGYRWSVLPESTPLLKLVGTSQTEPTKSGVGRPIVHIFRFQTLRHGDGTLRLHYVRSWEKPQPGETRFETHVLVR
jgi:inhibitor of cysteine peptidase